MSSKTQMYTHSHKIVVQNNKKSKATVELKYKVKGELRNCSIPALKSVPNKTYDDELVTWLIELLPAKTATLTFDI